MTLTRTTRIGEQDVTYEAQLVEIDVTNGKPVNGVEGPGARYVATEYVRTDISEADRVTRPVLFVFNGGPGSSSVWTHLGFGPRRVAEADSLAPRMTPPFTLVDNENTPLDVADLVFIDPVGTGFSRLHEGAETADFYGVEQDARATLEFISKWVRLRHREQSPRFISGESYGTLRAARMARMANGGPFSGGTTRSTSLTGAMVLGPSFALGEAGWAGDVRAALELPTLVRSARYHGVDVAETEAEVEQFARETLLPAIAAGTSMPLADRQQIAKRVSAMTGIDAGQILARNFTISLGEYTRMLLAPQGKHIGLYDSRFTLAAANAGNDVVADDPGMGRYAPQFTGVIETYLHDELGYETDLEYRAIDFRHSMAHWDYDGQRMASQNAFGDFAQALRRNDKFELFLAVGDYDLVSTIEANEYALSRFDYDRERVHLTRYESGHMPYLGAEPAAQFAQDVRDFIARLSAA